MHLARKRIATVSEEEVSEERAVSRVNAQIAEVTVQVDAVAAEVQVRRRSRRCNTLKVAGSHGAESVPCAC